MKATNLDLDVIAAELGITRATVNAHIRAAIAAGLLRVREVNEEQAVLEAVVPDTANRDGSSTDDVVTRQSGH